MTIDKFKITILGEWGIHHELDEIAQKVAAECGMSVSDILRKVLYHYYHYAPTGEPVGDMYFVKGDDKEQDMWRIPVENGFSLHYIIALHEYHGDHDDQEKAFVCNPFRRFIILNKIKQHKKWRENLNTSSAQYIDS